MTNAADRLYPRRKPLRPKERQMIVTSLTERVKGSLISVSASLVVAVLYVQAAAERRTATR